eukprot:TRINITY_DN8258_c0_g1_i1.p1 TRINITY_DN8258_c0_g1~~TRINITY_DN8258_c0_g1_i1.p1  ORF type:complete len:161 (+),score=15.85 TRINITY_DN8258_c0_g1_i1:61-543(+)
MVYSVPFIQFNNNQTNECQSISNISSTIQIMESDTSRFIYIGYASSAIITAFVCIIFALNLYIKNHPNLLQGKKKKNIHQKQSKPSLKSRESFYFYDDTEHDEEEEDVTKDAENENDDKSKDIEPFPACTNNEEDKKEAAENIALSVKSTRSNSIYLRKD